MTESRVNSNINFGFGDSTLRRVLVLVLLAIATLSSACTPPVPDTDPKKDASDWNSYDSCVQYQTLYGNPDDCDRVGQQYGSSYSQYSYGSQYGSSYGNGYGATPTYGSRVPYSSYKVESSASEVRPENFKAAFRDYLDALDPIIRENMVQEWRALSGE